MKPIPETIYLQFHGDAAALTPEELQTYNKESDITWCEDRINDTDVEYHRATASPWTSVKDMMPEDVESLRIDGVIQLTKTVLVWDGETMGTAVRERDGAGGVEWSADCNVDAEFITHWMPIPALPGTIK